MNIHRCIFPLILSLGLIAASTDLAAEQLSANHLSGAQRSGYSSQELPPPYHLAWTHQTLHKPRHAWSEPAWEVQRIDFDYAYAMAASEGLVYYSSSSDHAVHSLELASGKTRWRFFTEGPVRLAPTVEDGRVFFSSDDGWAYCLDGQTGTLLWKYRPNIPDERLIGNEQVISRHPARSGVLVDGGRAYTTFGMLSPEGIAITCLNADTGEVLWQNDTSGTRYTTQPHFEAMGGVSPQGYLALAGDVLVVPCGRATPAMFNANTGEFIYHEAEGLFPGGAWTMTFGDLLFTPCEYLKKPNPELPSGREAEISEEASMVALHASTGEEVFHLQGALKGVITPRGVLNLLGKDKLISVALKEVLKKAPDGYQAKVGSSEGHFVDASALARWETPTDRIFEIIQAGSTLIAGQRNGFSCYNADDGQLVWKTTVRGDVHELLTIGDTLLVGTTEGEIRCYRTGKGGGGMVSRPTAKPLAASPEVKASVADVLKEADVSQGFGIVLGPVGDPVLAELARQTDLSWNLASSGGNLSARREVLADSGLYGARIAVHEVSSDPLPYADYMANLTVVPISVNLLKNTPAAEVYRVTRPYGGVALIVCPDQLRPIVEQWLAEGGFPRDEWERAELGYKITRGALPGAGAWTHQYADAGKSGATHEQRARLPLKTLWFGGLGPADIVSRHYRAPAPLAINGIMFVPGNEYLHAVDAYTGRILWERDMPGVGRWPAAHRGGSIVADGQAVYVPRGNTCLRLDPTSGETTLKYIAPKIDADAVPDASIRLSEANKKIKLATENEPGWEYLAVTEDAIVGAIARPTLLRSWWSQARPEIALLFVLEKETGKLRWSYRPNLPISATGIAINGDRIFLVEGPAEITAKDSRRGVSADEKTTDETPRALIALNMKTGDPLWRTEEIGPSQDALWTAGDVVLANVPENHGKTGNLGSTGPKFSAFSAVDGSLLWSLQKSSPMAHTPVIMDDVIYSVSQAYDLHTGEIIHRTDPLTGESVPMDVNSSGGCGALAGCPTMLMKRSGSMGFVDLAQQSGTYHFPNMRAGCWINMIPACGLVLAPEGSSSCPCAYNYKASLAFISAERHNHWGLFSGSGWKQSGQITSLRLNFGVPGDRPTEHGTIWFAYPRPSTDGPRGAGGMGKPAKDDLPVEMLSAEGDITFVGHNPDWTPIVGTDRPWLHSGSIQGPVKLRIRLAEKPCDASDWKVTLFFHTLDEATRFDVKLQGQTVLTELDLQSDPRGTTEALARECSVTASEEMTLELIPRNGALPILDGLKIQAE